MLRRVWPTLENSDIKRFLAGQPSSISDAPSPWALMALRTAAIPTEGLRCKAWTEFTRSGAPAMDFVISLDEESWDSALLACTTGNSTLGL